MNWELIQVFGTGFILGFGGLVLYQELTNKFIVLFPDWIVDRKEERV